MFSLLCLFVALVVSHFGFEGRTLVLIASVPGNCFYLILLPLVTKAKKGKSEEVEEDFCYSK